ncbi:MAG: hypothetical protein ABSD20_04380 [Terriglobales bacterium]|jgi:hypothetical protein
MQFRICLLLAVTALAVEIACSSTTASPPSGSTGNSWTQFNDPSGERAFTVEVPSGWAAKGGMFRLGYSDFRFMVDLKSPDGKINVRIGDVGIPFYSRPGPHHRVGEYVDLGAQAQLTVANYTPGQEYAAKYAQVRFKELCQSLAPDPGASVTSVPDYLPADSAAKESTTGSVAYACDSGSGTMTAFVYARTNSLGDVWTVRTIVSYLAPKAQAAQAQSVMQHCLQTFHINPEFIRYQESMEAKGLQYQRERQQRRMRQVYAEVAQAEAKMQAMQGQVAAFERGQARQAAQVTDWTNTMIGITPTIDPMGNPKDVWTGTKSRYWQNGLGQTVNSNDPPTGGGWQEMKVVQH